MKTIYSLLFILISFTIEAQIKHQIDVLFIFVNHIASEANDKNTTTYNFIKNKTDQIITASNKVMDDSGVKIRFHSVGVTEVKLSNELISNLGYRILNSDNLSNVNDPRFDGFRHVLEKRYEYKADVVVYIDAKERGGVNSANKLGGKFNPYVLLKHNSGLSTYKFCHELGHVFGLTHEMGGTFPYAIELPGVKSIMAANCTQSSTNFNKSESLIFSGKNSYQNNTHFYQECAWDAVSILNEITEDISKWSEADTRGKDAPKNYVPNKIQDISAVNECITWAIDGYNNLWEWDKLKWNEVNTFRKFKHVFAKNYETVFLVDTDGTFITYDNYTKVFGMIVTPEKVKRIATNSSGIIYMLSESNDIYKWVRNGTGGMKWEQIPGLNNKFMDIDLTDSEKLWALATDGSILQWDEKWQSWPPYTNEKASEFSVGLDGTIVIISKVDNSIKISKHGSYAFNHMRNNVPAWCNCNNLRKERCESVINQNKGSNVSVHNINRIWALASERIYQYVGNNGFQDVYEYGQLFQIKRQN